MLTPRQELTIDHLKEKGIEEPMQIIEFCVKKMEQSWKTSYGRHPNAKHAPRRKHSKSYYQEIINHFAQQNS